MKLILFDLHGVLVHSQKGPHKRLSVRARPGLNALVDGLLDSGRFIVGIWTSAMAHNAWRVLQQAMEPRHLDCIDLFLCRKDCVRAPTREVPHATLKDLQTLWADPSRYGPWDARTTILVDDSDSKTVRQPQNAIIVPTFEKKDAHDDTVFVTLLKFLLEKVMPAKDVRAVLPLWERGPFAQGKM